MVRVKASFESEIRRFSLLKDAQYIQLYEQLCSLFSTCNLIVKYTDDEGDLVALESDVELAEAISIADKENAVLRISVGVIDESTQEKVNSGTSNGNEIITEPEASGVKSESMADSENTDKSTVSIRLKELEAKSENPRKNTNEPTSCFDTDQKINASGTSTKIGKGQGKGNTDMKESNGSNKRTNRRSGDRKKDSEEAPLSTAAKRRLKLAMK